MSCVRTDVRKISCIYTRILAHHRCNEQSRQNAAHWHWVFAQKLAQLRVGSMSVALHPNGLDFVSFPNCTKDIFHVEGIQLTHTILCNNDNVAHQRHHMLR